jgi:hypothetical protein
MGVAIFCQKFIVNPRQDTIGPLPLQTSHRYVSTERIVYHLCRRLDWRGHEVELFASADSRVNCTLQAVLPIASQDDPQSTFYLQKECEARNTYNLYRQAGRFDVIHAH